MRRRAHTAASVPRRAGFSLVEVAVSLAILSVVLGAFVVATQREAKGLREMAGRNAQERAVREMVSRLEGSLEYAVGATPRAVLTANTSAGAFELDVDTTQGFPPAGLLLIDPGTAAEERLEYAELDVVGHRFRQATRGAQCTDPAWHDKGAVVWWSGVAVPIEDQDAPPPERFDGVSAESEGPLWFRGDGTGFSFRLPTDPAGGTQFFDATGVRWGATVDGEPTLDGWSALYYQAVGSLAEAGSGVDLNGDGDRDDVFDLGRIRMTSWNAFVPGGGETDLVLCPPIVLQERCNWGGDLNGDGSDDPIFLWIPDEGRLRIRLALATGRVNERPVARRIDWTIHLRNGAIE